jgi:hypothetical protein
MGWGSEIGILDPEENIPDPGGQFGTLVNRDTWAKN